MHFRLKLNRSRFIILRIIKCAMCEYYYTADLIVENSRKRIAMQKTDKSELKSQKY